VVDDKMTVLGTDLGFYDWIPLFEERGPWKILVKTVMKLGSIKDRHSFNFCANIGFCRKTLSPCSFCLITVL